MTRIVVVKIEKKDLHFFLFFGLKPWGFINVVREIWETKTYQEKNPSFLVWEFGWVDRGASTWDGEYGKLKGLSRGHELNFGNILKDLRE